MDSDRVSLLGDTEHPSMFTLVQGALTWAFKDGDLEAHHDAAADQTGRDLRDAGVGHPHELDVWSATVRWLNGQAAVGAALLLLEVTDEANAEAAALGILLAFIPIFTSRLKVIRRLH